MLFIVSADSKRKLDAASHHIKRVVFECVRMHEKSRASIELDMTREERQRLHALAANAQLSVADYMTAAVEGHLDDALTSLANDVDAFIADHCERSDGLITPFSDLWQAYLHDYHGGLNETAFAAALTNLGFHSERRYIDGATKAVRTGVALTDSSSNP